MRESTLFWARMVKEFNTVSRDKREQKHNTVDDFSSILTRKTTLQNSEDLKPGTGEQTPLLRTSSSNFLYRKLRKKQRGSETGFFSERPNILE